MRNLETDFSLRRQKMDVPSHSSSLCLKISSDYSVIRGTEGRNLTLLLVIWGFAKHIRSTTVLRKIIFRVAEEVRNKENKSMISVWWRGNIMKEKQSKDQRRSSVPFLTHKLQIWTRWLNFILFYFNKKFPQLSSYNVNFMWPSVTEMTD